LGVNLFQLKTPEIIFDLFLILGPGKPGGGKQKRGKIDAGRRKNRFGKQKRPKNDAGRGKTRFGKQKRAKNDAGRGRVLGRGVIITIFVTELT